VLNHASREFSVEHLLDKTRKLVLLISYDRNPTAHGWLPGEEERSPWLFVHVRDPHPALARAAGIFLLESLVTH